MTIKAIILIGGPNKGQRFRPLSFDSPKHMFPVGGQTIIGHLIESCLKLEQLSEIILLGFHQQDETLSQSYLQNLVEKFTVNNKQRKGPVPTIKYLQEFTRMGTAGGLYHFRDQLRHKNPKELVVINGDVCGDFDFDSMLAQHRERIEWAERTNHPKPYITVMTTEADRQESLNYGCIVENPENHMIEHYVEKPSTFVSNVINCGAYICSLDLLDLLEDIMRKKRQESTCESGMVLNDKTIHTYKPDPHPDYLTIELDILQQRSNQPHCFAYRTKGAWWCQVKTAASAIYANKQYLEHYNKSGGNCQFATERRDQSNECTITGNVYIHPTAKVDASSHIGPNVSIMENCIIGPGVRIKDSIILKNAIIHPHSIILCSIVGWDCSIGTWVRIEGTPGEPDPNQRFAKVRNPPLFNPGGKLNPSISVLGSNVKVNCAAVILNSIVLPHKELSRSYINEIVL
jgi:mannose-1-phosphate guanylyltransferase